MSLGPRVFGVLWASGSQGLWVPGSFGFLGLWCLWVFWVSGSSGSLGLLGLWVNGSLGLWVSGSLGLWVSGSLGPWVFGVSGSLGLSSGYFTKFSRISCEPLARNNALLK